MAVGFALHEMVFDAEGRPVDYRFLDANPAYERITGLCLAGIRGKSVREVLPGIEERWIEAYGRVVLSGEPLLFTDFAVALGKHFEVWAYRPGPGRFVVMVRDVSDKKAAENAIRRQASTLKAVLGSIDSAVAFKGLDGRYLGCNAEYTRIFGRTEAELMGKTDADIFEDSKAASIRDEDRELLASDQPMQRGRLWISDSLGRDRLCEFWKIPLVAEGALLPGDREGQPFGIAVLWHDIGDTVLAEKANDIHKALALRGLSSTSREILELAVGELEAATGSGTGFYACLEDFKSPNPLVEECARAGRAQVVEGERAMQAADRLPPGHPHLERILLSPVLRGGEAVAVLAIANKASPYNDWDQALCAQVADSVWEIYERKKAQEKILDIAKQRDLAISAMKAGVETWYIEEDRKEYDERWALTLGYSLAELPGESSRTMELLCHPDDYSRAMEGLRGYLEGRAEGYEAEIRMRHKDGRWVWILNRAMIVERGPGGKPLRLSGLIMDIDGIKAVEERLRLTLHEKEILLQELFHRTKNTMQLINAMLELKKQGLESSPFCLAIEGIQGKIIAMSLVQEKLYRNGDLSALDLGDYLGELLELIKEGAPLVPDNITISSSTMPVPVSVDAAIPCGLIATELVTNALAYAFPGGAPGKISLLLSQAEGEISLAISDDGVGLPEGYAIATGTGLGLRTVQGIGEGQLRGRVEFGFAEKGFSFRLTFKDIFYPRRL